MNEDDRTEASRLAHTLEGHPADADHIADPPVAQKAILRPPLPLPEGTGAPAAGQDGLPVVLGQGLVQFKGGLDKPVETGNHEGLMPEEWKWVKEAWGLCEV